MVEELLGKGGFGAVYLVRDLRVRQNLFALKELHDPSKVERERFTFEGEVLRRLDHLALPRIYRVFHDDKSGRAYLLMDYIEGTNLERLRQQQPERRLALPQVLLLMAPIIDAVSYMHQQHPPIIHRDIKPANIIATKTGDGTVLVDFGIAKEYDPDSTTTAIRHCSPGYGAPEHYSRGTNTRTDIYGLGATIYALLTGVVPVDAFYRMTNMGDRGLDPLEPVNQLVPSIPAPVAEAIQRAMAMRMDDRFPTVEEFWQALNAHPLPADSADQQPPMIVPPARVRRLATIAHRTTAPQWRRRPRHLGILVLLAILLIGMGIVAGFFAATASDRTVNSPTPTITLQPTATPVPPTPTARPTVAPTPVPPAYPRVSGVHNGTVNNTTGGVTANMSLSIQQNGGGITGSFRVDFPLIGSGPLTGSVTANNHIQFVVHSNQVAAPLSFQGIVQSGGSMKGTYCSLDQAGHCNPAAGGAGNWSVSP